MVISLSMWPPRRRPNKTGSKTAPKPFLDDSQWNLIKDLIPKAQKSPKADARLLIRERVWRASFGRSMARFT